MSVLFLPLKIVTVVNGFRTVATKSLTMEKVFFSAQTFAIETFVGRNIGFVNMLTLFAYDNVWPIHQTDGGCEHSHPIYMHTYFIASMHPCRLASHKPIFSSFSYPREIICCTNNWGRYGALELRKLVTLVT